MFCQVLGGANDLYQAFIAYSSSNYSGVEHTTITPLDGTSYSVEDYVYNGETYRSISLTTSGGTQTNVLVYGASKLAQILV